MKTTKIGFGRRLFDRNLDFIKTIEVKKKEPSKPRNTNVGENT